jgi:hypothetical protein
VSGEQTAEGQIHEQRAPAGGKPGREGAGGASRRRFVQLVGATGGAAALSTLAAACGSGAEGGGPADVSSGPPEPATDLEIVNYALFLEYFEEQFYTEVMDSDAISDPALTKLIGDIRQNEREHADALAAVAEQLGGTAAPRPKTKFEPVIRGGQQKVLEVGSVFENLGAAAYLGQAPRIENSRLLETALTIHSVEARHAAALNDYAGFEFQSGDELKGSVPNGAFGRPMTREEVLTEAEPYLKV